MPSHNSTYLKYPTDVRQIHRECIRSLFLQKWGQDASAKSSEAPANAMLYGAKEIALFKQHVRSHCRSLTRISKLEDPWKRRVMMDKLVLPSFPAHVCALLRAHSRRNILIPPGVLLELAKESKQWHPLTEAIDARWVKKPKGGFRLIRSEGPARIARRLVIRDALQIMNVESDIDYTKKGAGGERAFVKQVCSLIEGGYQWWWTPDIKNYFASLRPSHFKWLPLTRKLVQNEVFTPKCAKVNVTVSKDVKQTWLALKTQYPSLISDVDGFISFTVQMVRLGLPEGSILSPLLARGFVGRELQLLFGELSGVSKSSFMDDLAIGTRSRKKIQAAMKDLTERLALHPAGPIELHSASAMKASSWKKPGQQMELLGYKVQPGNGYKGSVHVVPGKKRIDRFKQRLKDKLDRAEATSDPHEIGLIYWKRWFDGQLAWTKVPVQTELVSENIALSYIEDYVHGLAMGKNATIMTLQPASEASQKGPFNSFDNSTP